MTSIPASRRARATILAPRSWPSNPGLATTTRTLRSVSSVMVLGRPAGEHAAKLLADLHDLAAITGHRLPVEALAVVRPARDEVQMEVRHRLEGGRAVGLEHVEPVGLDGAAQGVGNTLGGNDGRLQVFVVTKNHAATTRQWPEFSGLMSMKQSVRAS